MHDTPPQPTQRLKGRAEALGHALPPLLLAAERVAEIVMHGVHGRHRAGPGDEFWQFRAYMPGDAATSIDWRRSARAGRLYVRENEWTAASTLWLWVQDEAGMHWRSHLADTSKHERALLLGLALARLAQRAGERSAILDAPLAPDHTRAAWERMAHWWLRNDDGNDTGSKRPAPAGKSRQMMADEDPALPPARQLPRFSSLVLIGDFLVDTEALTRRMTQLAAGGVRGHLLQVLDPAEETFPFEGRVRFSDMSGTRHFLSERAEDMRSAYTARLAGLRRQLADHARRLGWTFQLHHTDQPPQQALLSLFARLQDAPLQSHAEAAS